MTPADPATPGRSAPDPATAAGAPDPVTGPGAPDPVTAAGAPDSASPGRSAPGASAVPAGTAAPVRPTRLEVDLDAIRHNVEVLRRAAAPAEVCAVVKADGYGHGAVPVARAALDAGATWLAVALVEEGEALRAAGIDAPVLLLSEPPPSAASRLADAELVPTVYTPELVAALDAVGRDRGRPVPVHLGVDTGMSRVGAPPDRWGALLAAVVAADHLDVAALWTHLARADEAAAGPVTRGQLERFGEFRAQARSLGLTWRVEHAANSAGTLLHPDARRDLVRAGIAVYGLSPGPEVPARSHGLQPAMRLVSAVAYVKRVPAGTAVSYGHTWTAPTGGWLATVPLGYADGVPRVASNRIEVLIGGARRPQVGNVTMDQLMVWCGEDGCEPGDEVVLLGRQGDEEVSVDDWADAAGTITYEIATGITARVPRIYHADRTPGDGP